MPGPRLDIVIGSNVKGFTSGIDTVMGKLRGLVSLGLFAKLAKDAIAFGSALNDVAGRTGVSLRWLQEMSFAAQQTGASMEELANAIFEVRRAQAQALGGSKGDAGAFATLGISVEDLKKLNAEQIFDRISDSVHKTGGGVKEVNAAMQVLGRGGRSLITGMVDGFDELRQTARDYGLVLEDEVIEAMDQLGDNFDILTLAIRVSTAELLKNITSLSNWVSFAKMAKTIAVASMPGAAFLAYAKGGVPGLVAHYAGLGAEMNGIVDEFQAGQDQERDASRARRERKQRSGEITDGPGGARGSGPVKADSLMRQGGYVGGVPGFAMLSVQQAQLRELRALRAAVDRNTTETKLNW